MPRRDSPRRAHLASMLSVILAASVLTVVGADPVSAGAAAPKPPQRTRSEVRREIDVMRATGDQLETQLATMDSQLRDQRARLTAATANLAIVQAEADVAAAAAAASQVEADRTASEVRKFAVDTFMHPPSEGIATILASSSLSEAHERSSMLAMQTSRRGEVLDDRKVALADLRGKESAAVASRDVAKAAADEEQAALTELEGSREERQRMTDQLDQRVEADLGEIAALDAVDRQRAAALQAQNQRIAQLAAASAQVGASLIPNQPIAAPPPTNVPRVVPPPLVSPGEVVSVHGIVVNISIATSFNNMFEAATAAGIVLGGSGYRDSATQIALRIAHCGPTDYDIYYRPSSECSPPTARPGQSMHEQGLAIDFTCSGVLINTHVNPCWIWLDANAATYGFYNLDSEPWHWSVNGR